MKLFKATRHAWHQFKAALSLTDARGWEGTTLLGARTSTGRSVSPTAAQQLSVYYACIRNIAEDVAKLPLFVYEQLQPRGKQRAFGHPASSLLKSGPNPAQTKMTFVELMIWNTLSWGNGFAEIQRDQLRRPVRLWPIDPPTRVKVSLNEDGTVTYTVQMQGGQKKEIASEDMIHVRGPGGLLVGWSIATIAAVSIDLGLSQQEFQNNFIGNGINLAGVLEHPGTVEEPAAKRLKASWREQHGGTANAGGIAVLEEGLQFKPISMKMTDAQFIQSRRFTVEEFARWFRMPPHKIQDLSRATFGNIEQQSIEYVTDTLQSWLTRLESELDRKLVPEPEFFVQHSVQALLRGDNKTRAEYYAKLFSVGALSQNDIRDLENRNPIDNGDVYYVPMNLAPVSTTPGQRLPPPLQDTPGTATVETYLTLAQVLPAMRDAADRMAGKERNALINAFKKAPGIETREAVERFFSVHPGHLAKALTPTVTMALGSGVNGELTSLADSLCESLKASVIEDPSTVAAEIQDGEYIEKRSRDIISATYDLISEKKKNSLLEV